MEVEILELPVSREVRPERRGPGSVPGLEDDELADVAELLRMARSEFWEALQHMSGRRREWHFVGIH